MAGRTRSKIALRPEPTSKLSVRRARGPRTRGRGTHPRAKAHTQRYCNWDRGRSANRRVNRNLTTAQRQVSGGYESPNRPTATSAVAEVHDITTTRDRRAPVGMGRPSHQKARSTPGDFTWTAPTTSTSTDTNTPFGILDIEQVHPFSILDFGQVHLPQQQVSRHPEKRRPLGSDQLHDQGGEVGDAAHRGQGHLRPDQGRPGQRRPTTSAGVSSQRTGLPLPTSSLEARNSQAFADEAGLASPGRRSKDHRNLHLKETADETRKVSERGLGRTVTRRPGKSLRPGDPRHGHGQGRDLPPFQTNHSGASSRPSSSVRSHFGSRLN